MRKLRNAILFASALIALQATAQETQKLTANKHNEYGIIYSLPVTHLNIEVEAVKTVKKAGPYYKYAKKYLGVSKVISHDSQTWEIKSIKITPYGVPNKDNEYLMKFKSGSVPYLLLETICIAFLGTVVGAIISIPLAFLSASNLTPRPVSFAGRVIIMAVRTVPAFVYGLMFIRVTGPGAFAGLLTMSLCSVGMVSKMYIEAIEDLDVRVLESLDAAGCTTWQKIRYGILPQLMPNFASTAIYRFDINLRDATVLGLVGAGGIGAPLIFAMNAYRWEEAGAILAGLIVLVLIVEWISTRIRVKLARG